MQTNPQRRWGLRLATLCVWALAAASIAYWGLLVRSPAGGAVAAMVPAVSAAVVEPARLARLLGAVDTPAAAAPAVSASSRFSLVGVIADTSGSGAALIAVDGKPARPYRVGASVDTGYVLKSVGPRQAMLAASADAPAAITLEMPQMRPGSSAPGVPPARYTSPPQLTPPSVVPNMPQAAPQQQPGPGMQPQSQSGPSAALGGQGASGELRKRNRLSFAAARSTGDAPAAQPAQSE